MPSARRLGRLLLAVVAKLWNSPNTLIGLALGVLGLRFRCRIDAHRSAFQFLDHPLLLPGYALTLGNVVLYGRGARPEDVTSTGASLAEHERQHTLQGEQLGPAYLISNVLGGVIAIARDGRWHGPSNWNERGPLSVPPRPWA